MSWPTQGEKPVAGLERMVQQLHSRNETVWLHKLAATTYIGDLTRAGRDARIQYGAMPWRCKIGLGRKWHYAATAEEAMAKAMSS